MLDESALPLSRARLALIVRSLGEGVAIADLDGQAFLVNPAAMTILGMPSSAGSQQVAVGGGPGPLTLVTLPEWPSSCGFFRSDMVTPYLAQDLPLARSLRGETLSDEQVFVRDGAAPDGAWLSIDSTPLRNDDGAIDGSVMVFRDVTVKKREMEQFELLSNVVEQTADSVLVTDRDGRIEYVNPACEATTGYSRAELLGRTPSIFKSGVHGSDFYTDLWKTLAGGQTFRGTLTDRKKSGELYLSQQTITPIRWQGQPMTHLVSVARDITGLTKAAEREHELLLARSVQQRLYPKAPPVSPGFDIFGAAFVADVTGGDYFDFLVLPGDRLGIVIADVSGHGFDSALLMAETRAVLRSAVETKSDPGEILETVNRVLAADMEGNRFVTMLLACLHAPTRRFTYASAGHDARVLDQSGRNQGRVGCNRVAARTVRRRRVRDKRRDHPRARGNAAPSHRRRDRQRGPGPDAIRRRARAGRGPLLPRRTFARGRGETASRGARVPERRTPAGRHDDRGVHRGGVGERRVNGCASALLHGVRGREASAMTAEVKSAGSTGSSRCAPTPASRRRAQSVMRV